VGFALAIVAMFFFAMNILITRYAVARMPVESGFFIVLATNILFPAAIFAVEVTARAAPFGWNWKGVGLFALGGVIGTFLGRRLLFDTVRLLGPARASVFHSTAPAFALLGAWLLADELLGAYELVLVAVVWAGLWLTHPPAGSRAGEETLSASTLRMGMIAGLFTVAGFGFGNVLRGLAMRAWSEAVLGTVIASLAALACQVVATRDWDKIRSQWRAADRRAVLLYVACGVATSLGALFITFSMLHLEIALAVVVVHTTPLVIFPVSVFLLGNREQLSGRTATGALIVLAGIALLALR
jgi:drug/metabolite transporter (DMT)-like permease